MAQIETTQEWVKGWEGGRLARVMAEMEALRRQHNGMYELSLYPSGGGAFSYENPFKGLRTAVDFDAESNIENYFEQFKGRVETLFT